MTKLLILFLVLCGGLVLANSRFADRGMLGGELPLQVAATHVESIGSDLFPLNPTRWWTWSPPRTGWYQLTLDSVHQAFAVILEGENLPTLRQRVRSSTTTASEAVEVPFFAEADAPVQILILAAHNAPPGRFSFEVVAVDHPSPNDSFADRVDLGEIGEVMIQADNYGATAEPDEPRHDGWDPQASVWWSFTSAASESYQFEITKEPSPGFNPRFAIYEGDSSGSLVELKSFRYFASSSSHRGEPWQETFDLERGKQYHLVMDRAPLFGAAGGSIGFRLKPTGPVLSWPIREQAPNDDFVEATDLGTEVPLTFIANFNGATRLIGEEVSSGTGAFFSRLHQTVWWRWESPGDGTFLLGPEQRPFYHDYFLKLITENSEGELFELSQHQFNRHFSPRKVIEAAAGQVFYFMLGSTSEEPLVPLLFELDSLEPSLNRSPETAISLGRVDHFKVQGERFTQGELPLVWQWTPASGGDYQLSSSPYTWLRLYEVESDGSLRSIWPDSAGKVFSLEPGLTYQAQVGGTPGSFSSLELNRLPDQSNDDFEDAVDLGSTEFVRSKSHFYGSGLEEKEPDTFTSKSLWWKWRVPFTGVWQISGDGHWLEFFRGTSLENLEPATGPAIHLRSLWLEGGETYYIRLTADGVGEALLTISRGLASRNELRAQAVDLGHEAFAEGHGDYTLPTSGPGEPGTRNLWWRWTAPRDGEFRLSNRAQKCRFNVYRGQPEDRFADLELVELRRLGGLWRSFPENDLELHEAVVFTAREGEDYLFVSSTDPEANGAGRVNFLLSSFQAPDGDTFANRIDLGGRSAVRYQGYAANATVSVDDPSTAQSFAGSIWMTWKAPATGYFEIENFGSGEDAMGVYLGDEPARLREIVLTHEDEDEDRFFTGFFAEEGSTYQILYLTEGNQAGFEIVIKAPRSYEDWVSAWQESLARRQLPLMTDEEMKRHANPRQDGISNFTKYVFGLNPTNDGTRDRQMANLPTLTRADNYLEIRYRLGSTAAFSSTIRIRHFGEWSHDGKTWSRIEPVSFPIGTDNYRVRVPIDDGKKFLRVRAIED